MTRCFTLRTAILNAIHQSPHATTLAPAGALLALSLAAATTQAAESSDQTLPTIKAQDSTEAAPAVTQVGKVPQLLRDVPQTISVINRETLDAQGATTLGEALRNVPGITLSAGEGGVIGDNVNLRGFSARTDVFIDGMRDRGQYSRETFFLESVEVLKGPSSMLFGRGSTGGVINQVSKQPSRRESTTAGASLGTDNYYRVTADTNQPISESTAFRVAAFGHKAESTRDVVESERYGIAPSLRFGMGSPTQIALSAIIQHRDDIPDYGFPFDANGTKENPARPKDLARQNFLGYTDDRFEQDVKIVSARVSHDFSSAVTLRNQTQFSDADVFAQPTVISGTTGVRGRRQREIEDQSLFNQTDLIVKLNGETISHTITTGAEIGRDDYESQSYTTTAGATSLYQNMVDPIYGPLPADAVITKNTFTENVGKTLAAYVNEQLDIGTHWKLIGGVRWDRFGFDTAVTTSSTGAVVIQPTKTDKMTSMRAGVVYQPDDIQTYYVSYGTSFNPSAETLTSNAANLRVDPEENRSYELGAKLNYNNSQLLITSALFRVEKTNARTTDSVLAITTLDGDILVQGFELGISGSITDKWKMLAGYTYLDSEIRKSLVAGETGNRYQNTPKHNASLWSTYDLPIGLQLGGGLVYVDDRLLNNANTAKTDSYTRVDATVAYITSRYSVRVNLQNLTNKLFFETASGGRATPAAGRTAIASFNWTF